MIKFDLKNVLINKNFFFLYHSAISKTYHAADLRIIFNTTRIPQHLVKDKLPANDSKNVIYLYTCACSSSYIGRTSRKLSSRIKEHLPKWLLNNEQRSSQSGIARHIIQNKCVPNPELFTILFRTTTNLLPIYEALAIRHYKPSIVVQKYLVHNLSLF